MLERRSIFVVLRDLVAGVLIFMTGYFVGLSGFAFYSALFRDVGGGGWVVGLFLVLAALVCFWGTEKFWIYSKRWQ